MTPAPPRTARVLLLLLGLSARRYANRLFAGLARKKAGTRGPTAPKRAGGGVALAFFALVFVFQGVRAAAGLVNNARNWAHGDAAFSREHAFVLGPARDLWPARAELPAALAILGAVMAVFGLTVVASSLAGAKDELARVEWTTEWLYQMPASARALHLAKLLERAVIHPLLWLIGLPVWLTFGWCAGLGAWSLPLAIAVTLEIGLVSGACHLVVETALRLSLSPSQVKNAQALFTLLGALCTFALVWLGLRVELPAAVLARLASLRWLAWSPFGVGVLVIGGSWPAAALALGYAVAIPWAAVAACDRMVRNGLSVSSGTVTGARGVRRGWRKGGLGGIAGKDARLLLRDRTLLMQTLFMPIVMFAFQLTFNPFVLEGILASFRSAAAVGFFAGAYGFAFSAFNVLAVEGRALWLLYTFPRPLYRVLAGKVALWSVFGLSFVAAMVVLGLVRAHPDASAIADAITAIAGTVIYAFIAAGIGCLATDPLAATPNDRRGNPLPAFLYLFLTGLYARALYADSLWLKAVQLVLSALLAVALWQKVRDRIPYLLDPTEAPPPAIAVGDGLVAVLAFFVLQGVVSAAAIATADVSPSVALVVAFAGAGFVVSASALYFFWRAKVPMLLRAIGLSRPAGQGRPIWIAAPAGIAAGAGAAAIALAYLFALEHVGPLRALRDASPMPPVPTIQRGALVVVAVVAAPLFEELIFRSLIFRGLRRTWGFLPAAAASAAIFAICHPPLAIVPVFGLGFAAALVFERTQLLAAPIAAHVAYNGIMMLLSR